MEISMKAKITLTQSDIEEAIAQYISAQGLNIEGKELEFSESLPESITVSVDDIEPSVMNVQAEDSTNLIAFQETDHHNFIELEKTLIQAQGLVSELQEIIHKLISNVNEPSGVTLAQASMDTVEPTLPMKEVSPFSVDKPTQNKPFNAFWQNESSKHNHEVAESNKHDSLSGTQSRSQHRPFTWK